ncbi:MAG: hypothetical protein ACE5HC_04870 [Candidatus Binatia bacterium]
MKFDIQLPSVNGIARMEIKTALEGAQWVAYISFVSGRPTNETCLMLGEQGIPYRFTGPSEQEVQKSAKQFLDKHYRIVRMIW